MPFLQVISKSKISGLLGDSVTIKRSELNALKNKAVLKTVDRRSIAKEKRQKALAERSRIRKCVYIFIWMILKINAYIYDKFFVFAGKEWPRKAPWATLC